MTRRTRYFLFGSIVVLLVGLCTGLVAYYSGVPWAGSAGPTAPPSCRMCPPRRPRGLLRRAGSDALRDAPASPLRDAAP